MLGIISSPRESAILFVTATVLLSVVLGSWRDRAMASSKTAPDPSGEEGDGRPSSSNLESARRSEYKTDDDFSSTGRTATTESGGLTSCNEADVVGPRRVQRLKSRIQDLKAHLAEEKKSNEQAQAQSKREYEGHLRQVHTQLSGKETELEEMQTRLEREQQLREDEGAKLRKANVLLRGQQQEIKDLQTEHDRLQAIVEERNAARLLAGGINIQAACATLPEIETLIRRALTVTVSEWIEDSTSSLPPTVCISMVLSAIFFGCRELVNGIVRKHTAFMGGGIGSEGGPSTMDEATVDLFRQHIRRHHRTLFPLAGESLQRACNEVVYKAAHFLAPTSSGKLSQELMNTKLGRVVAEYLPILVGVSLLHPPVVFSNDLSTMQPFNATVHAESIDGDAVHMGQACLVVFPALVAEREGEQGFHPVSKPYILPVAKF